MDSAVVLLQFIPIFHNSTEQFGFSFAYDAPMV